MRHDFIGLHLVFSTFIAQLSPVVLINYCGTKFTGKKGKKQKWIPANITDILAEPTTVPTTANWADSVEEERK